MHLHPPNPVTGFCALILMVVAGSVQAEVDIFGFASAQLVGSKSTTSWLEGGFGRLDTGDEDKDKFAIHGQVKTRLALDWSISPKLDLQLHGLARYDQAQSSSKDVGLVEAYLRYFAVETPGSDVSITLGQRFFPSSLEASDELWQTPYTLSYSALTSWLGHEFRPIGVELDYFQLLGDSAVNFALNLFKGNDTSGTELAWGGWRFSQRLSVYGEVLPLPPLFSLEDTGAFYRQRDSGSKVFGSDLDDRWGAAGMVELIPSDSFRAVASYADNRGDLRLYGEDYAWDTEFYIVGFHWQISSDWEILGEYLSGNTMMGRATSHVDTDFQSAYLLASWRTGRHRLSARYDDFKMKDLDGGWEISDEDGDGVTVAYFYYFRNWRLGLEAAQIKADRIAAAQSGYSEDTDGVQLTMEVHYRFN